MAEVSRNPFNDQDNDKLDATIWAHWLRVSNRRFIWSADSTTYEYLSGVKYTRGNG